MITLTILLGAFLIITLALLFVLATAGTIGVIVFGDLLFAIAIVVVIIRLIKKFKKRR
jgi:hypothetical protein